MVKINFEFSNDFKKIVKTLENKNPKMFDILKNKINEIINSNNINRYKNLRSPLNHYKRVHITNQFVLIFKVDYNINKIMFISFGHRKEAYKNLQRYLIREKKIKKVLRDTRSFNKIIIYNPSLHYSFKN